MRTRLLAAGVLLPFLVFSTWVAVKEGFVPFFTLPWTHPIWSQEFLDLCIALCFVSGWLMRDARRRGANPWPYLVATPLLGSIAPLTYLILRPERPEEPPPSAPGGGPGPAAAALLAGALGLTTQGCVWMTCEIAESTVTGEPEESDPRPVRVEASADAAGPDALTLHGSQVEEVTRTTETTVERTSDLGFEWKSYCLELVQEQEPIIVLFGFPLVLAFDLAAPPFQWGYQLVRGSFGAIDSAEGESTQTEERTGPLPEASLTSPVVGASGSWQLGPQPPGGWTIRRDDLELNGLPGDRVIVEAPSGLRCSVDLPRRPEPAPQADDEPASPPSTWSAPPPPPPPSPPARAAPGEGLLVLLNQSGFLVRAVRLAPGGRTPDGPDRLQPGEDVELGARRGWSLPPDGRYRVRVELEDGRTVEVGDGHLVEADGETVVALTLEDLR